MDKPFLEVGQKKSIIEFDDEAIFDNWILMDGRLGLARQSKFDDDWISMDYFGGFKKSYCVLMDDRQTKFKFDDDWISMDHRLRLGRRPTGLGRPPNGPGKN